MMTGRCTTRRQRRDPVRLPGRHHHPARRLQRCPRLHPTSNANTATGGWPAHHPWDSDQVANAATILTPGHQQGVPPRGWTVALSTAMQEASLRNLLSRVAAGKLTTNSKAAPVRDSIGWPMMAELRSTSLSVARTVSPTLSAVAAISRSGITTTPDESRELSRWAGKRRINYLDGAIMATPQMIGSPESVILYSGSPEVFDGQKSLLDLWATSTYVGEDPGLASMWDLAMLSGMYSMFAGFLHGVALLQTAGVSAAEYAERAAPFLAAMTELLGHSTKHLDTRDYSEPLQSLRWTTTLLGTIARASQGQGIKPAPVEMVQELIRQQIDAGFGAQDFDRIIESMRA